MEPNHRWMEQALDAARQAQGRTSPNPPVGAVVVRDDQVVGCGWTQPPGGPHAEVVALNQAGIASQNADLYVTLEPCTFWGRTPPCTDAIIRAGIRQVFFAAHDPDRRMGQGAAAVLAQSNINAIHLAAFAAPAEALIAAFRCWTTQGRPLVIAKYAMTLDGKIATQTGDSRWISGSESRRRVHELRDQVDAILVGVGTVLADDPQLTTRLTEHWRSIRHPLRVVVDSQGRTPLSARILAPHVPGHTLFATVAPPEPWRKAVEQRGAEVLILPPDAQNRVDLRQLLAVLGARGIASILVEGGAQILGTLAAEQLTDRLWIFVAPKLVGGSLAPGPVGNPGKDRMADAVPWRFLSYEQIGPDLLVIAEPERHNRVDISTSDT